MLLIVTSPAFAFDCLAPSPEGLIAISDLIFQGTVISERNGPTGKIRRGRMTHPITLFKVSTTYKGKSFAEIEIKQKNNSITGNWRFTIGEEVAVFANLDKDGGYKVNYCSMESYDFFSAKYAPALEEYRIQCEAFSVYLQQPNLSAPILLEYATFFAKHGALDNAEKAYSELLRLAPREVSFFISRGELKYKMKRYEEALADYSAALEIDEQNVEARRGQTFSVLKLNKLHELSPDEKDFSSFDSGRDRINFSFLKLQGAIFHKAKLRKTDFSSSDLRGADFREAKLNHVDFSGADLSRADFTGAEMYKCNFHHAKFSETKFENLKRIGQTKFMGARIESVSFKGANLRGAQFDGVNLGNADFSESDLEKASLEYASVSNANFSGTKLILAHLRGTTWNGHDLSDVDFRGADLQETFFLNTNMNGAVFGQSTGIMNLSGADFSGTDLSHIKWGWAVIDCRTKLPPNIKIEDLPVLALWSGCSGDPPKTTLKGGHPYQRGPRLNRIDAPRSKLSKLDLSGFGFWNVRFDGSDFSGSNLSQIDIQGGSYIQTNFNHAMLNKAFILRANFDHSSFENADLSNARLTKVDFRGASLKGAILMDACYDKKTLWPDGFDPAMAGAKLVASPLQCR